MAQRALQWPKGFKITLLAKKHLGGSEWPKGLGIAQSAQHGKKSPEWLGGHTKNHIWTFLKLTFWDTFIIMMMGEGHNHCHLSKLKVIGGKCGGYEYAWGTPSGDTSPHGGADNTSDDDGGDVVYMFLL